MTRLFRPVGLNELALIWDSGCREFPPRLPDQPIFYPVTSVEYATQIARDWNTKTSSFAGFVTAFDVDEDYLSQFERHVVGSAIHEEYWIPAKQLHGFNQAIQSLIEVESAFFGQSFGGYLGERCGFKGKNAQEQFVILAHSWDYSSMDFELEIAANPKSVFLNSSFWAQNDFSDVGIANPVKHATLAGVTEVWKRKNLSPHLSAAFHKAVAAP